SFDATPDPNGDSGPIKVGPPDSGTSDAASNPDGGPIACTAAGGTCVGLAPGTCPGNNFGDAKKYSCGGGLGVARCLPCPRKKRFTGPRGPGQSRGMKRISFFLFALSLAVGCSSSAPDDEDTSQTEADIKKHKKLACSAVGGSCVGLTPYNCQ